MLHATRNNDLASLGRRAFEVLRNTSASSQEVINALLREIIDKKKVITGLREDLIPD